MRAKPSRRYWKPLTVMIIVVAYSFVAGQYQLFLISLALVFSILAMSLDLVWGYAGILDLGHVAFFALGSYAMAFALRNFSAFGAPPSPAVANTYAGLVLAIIIPSALALGIGYAGFYSGARIIYFALISLAVTLVLGKLFIDQYYVTGGSNGITNIPQIALGVPFLPGFVIQTPLESFYLILAFTVITYFLLKRTVDSPFGKVLMGIRANESRAVALGYDVRRYKLLAYIISAGGAGLAGALFAPLNGIVYPDLFGLVLAAQVFVWVAVGGEGTLIGPVLGAVIMKVIESSVRDLYEYQYLIIIGIVFILMVTLFPKGFWGILEKFRVKMSAGGDSK